MTTSVLRITDGTTTKTFTSGDDMKLIAFEPRTSEDGSDIEENAKVDLVSITATNRANINSINRLFAQARNYAKTQTGPQVHIEFDPGTSGTAWRSLVRDGRVILHDKILGPWQYDTRMRITIEWRRQGFWEGALTQIPLTNSSATDDTGGITISNVADSGTCQVETATVVGTITGNGNATVILTATGMTGTPITKNVAVVSPDTPSQVAVKIAAALNGDANITARFNIVTDTSNIIITRLVAEANDPDLNLSVENGSCTGLTNDTSSTDTLAGSATDKENWIQVNDEDVSGDLPAPIKLQMYNSKNGADASKEIYVWHNVHSTPASLPHILEGENATSVAAGATLTDTALTTCSGGLYESIAWTATTETALAEFALSTADLSKMAGGRFAIIARWAALFPYTNCYLRVKLLSTTNYNVLWSGNLALVNSTRELTWLDSLRLPPYLIGQANLKGIVMRLYGLRETAGTHTIKLDYLQLSPISYDTGWKRFLSVDNGVAYQEYFTHDETEGITYRTDTSSKIISEFTDYGGPILLAPNTDQKLYFNSSDYVLHAYPSQTWAVKLWYRPRYNSL